MSTNNALAHHDVIVGFYTGQGINFQFKNIYCIQISIKIVHAMINCTGKIRRMHAIGMGACVNVAQYLTGFVFCFCF